MHKNNTCLQQTYVYHFCQKNRNKTIEKSIFILTITKAEQSETYFVNLLYDLTPDSSKVRHETIGNIKEATSIDKHMQT